MAFKDELQVILNMLYEDRYLTKEEVAKKIGVHKTTLHRYLAGEFFPNSRHLNNLCSLAGMGKDVYRKLLIMISEEKEKKEILDKVLKKDNPSKEFPDSQVHFLPFIPRKKAKHYFQKLSSKKRFSPNDWIPTDLNVPMSFYVAMEDDSMSPYLESGDLVFFGIPTDYPHLYRIVFASDGDKFIIRQVRLAPGGRGCVLHPLNSKYEDINYEKPFLVLGVAFRIIRTLQPTLHDKATEVLTKEKIAPDYKYHGYHTWKADLGFLQEEERHYQPIESREINEARRKEREEHQEFMDRLKEIKRNENKKK